MSVLFGFEGFIWKRDVVHIHSKCVLNDLLIRQLKKVGSKYAISLQMIDI